MKIRGAYAWTWACFGGIRIAEAAAARVCRDAVKDMVATDRFRITNSSREGCPISWSRGSIGAAAVQRIKL